MHVELAQKYQALKSLLASYKRVVVAFSAGVDSTLLLFVAHEVLGDNVVAVTATSPLVPQRERDEARAFCADQGIDYLECATHEMESEEFRHNSPNRCYLCKHELFSTMIRLAHSRGIESIVEGSNLDDLDDYRPGLAAIQELGIQSPLREAGFTKQDIRDLSYELGLPTWRKQSFACLASRFPYGDSISEEKLVMIDKAEQFLLDRGFHQVRVRVHGLLARIEMPKSCFDQFMDEAFLDEVYKAFKTLGFTYVTLDIAGYRSGSMNEVL